MDKDKDVFIFPDIWQDDNRMNVLFAPFRPKTINPIEWESKLAFWKNLIYQYCHHKKSPVFCLNILQDAFRRKGLTPACIQAVIDELQSSGDIIPYAHLDQYSFTGESLLNWLVRAVIKTPLQWTIDKAKASFTDKTKIEPVTYIHIPVAKKLGEDTLKNYPSNYKGELIDIAESKSFSQFSEETLRIILRPLIEMGTIAVEWLPSNILLKVKKDDEGSVSITTIDKSVYQLKTTEKTLKNIIEDLEAQKENAFSEVKKSLAAQRKQMAKSWLRRKHDIEKLIEKRASALDNIHSLLDKIQQAESDSLVLDSYKIGIAAFKDTYKTKGLSEEGAETTMNELRDVFDMSMDLEEALSQSIDLAADRTLEEELEELLAKSTSEPSEVTESKENEEIVYPDVPNENLHDVNVLERRLQALAM